MVLGGCRRGIGSILGVYLVPRGGGNVAAAAAVDSSASLLPSCAEISEGLSCRSRPMVSTACYISVLLLRARNDHPENDLKTAKLSYITELIVVTNADIDDDDEDEDAAAR